MTEQKQTRKNSKRKMKMVRDGLNQVGKGLKIPQEKGHKRRSFGR